MLSAILKLLLAFLFVALNGFFVLSEFAMVKVRKTRLDELSKQNVPGSALGLKIVNNLDSYLSSTQLGITLASLALGWLGEPAIASLLRPILERFLGESTVLLHTVSVVIAFVLITFMHVVLGEIVPKSIAIQKAEATVLKIARPMMIFHSIAYPLVYLFNHIAAFFLNLIGMTPGKDTEPTHSEEELRMLVSASYSDGILDDTEGTIINNMFGFSDRVAREVMVPRTDMTCLYLEDSYEDNVKEVLASRHTRFPLCNDDKDNVIGMIHLRDLLENANSGTLNQNLQELKREVLFVPETQHITNIMQLMRSKQIHLAVVIDEYGGTAGIITLEDILEEIVGEINDEYDMDDPEYLELSKGIYEINGLVEQGHVEKLLNINLGDQDDETIGGFVFSLLGRMAEVGDKVTHSGYVFEVTEMSGLRVNKLKVYELTELAEESGE